MPDYRKMRRQPVKPVMDVKPPKTSHVIHEDGTWSNEKTTVVQKESIGKSLKVYDFIFFEDDTKWQVLETYDWGVALAAYPRKTQPSMYNAVPYSWDELDSNKIRKV